MDKIDRKPEKPKIKPFLIDKELKTKDLRQTAVGSGKRITPKPESKPRIAYAEGRVKPLARIAYAASLAAFFHHHSLRKLLSLPVRVSRAGSGWRCRDCSASRPSRGASQAAAQARLLRCATALRVTAPLSRSPARLWRRGRGCSASRPRLSTWRHRYVPKGSLSARPHGPNTPLFDVVRCYRTLFCPALPLAQMRYKVRLCDRACSAPLSPRKQSSLRIGPEQSGARSGEADP